MKSFVPSQQSSVFIFSHPNHELAVYGLAQRLRPHFLFLSDGGAAERVAQTRRGLARIGLHDHAHFLNYTEDSFYTALLEVDVALCRAVADRIREWLDQHTAALVFCDAVEFYNPVHDLSLPLVRAALAHTQHAQVFEVPLVYQCPGEGERYKVQRVLPTHWANSCVLDLTETELAAKLAARDEIYGLLRHQLGGMLAVLPDAHFAREEFAPAVHTPPSPETGRVLRYEWRGALRKQRGEVERSITYADHYLPLATTLVEHPPA